MNTLSGKTLYLTGASRGIGKAIALRAARDGANVVIAAKTSEADPRLPGTIHEAAREVKAAGGQVLAVMMDARDAAQVAAAVAAAVERFGGIDILINNASAIALGGVAALAIKRYDLMFDINVRGSYLCAKACLPHRMKSLNPHILTLSPPIDLDPKWFAGHSAYTASTYAMSMISLGLSQELRSHGIAANSLWPRTFIATAALNVARPEQALTARTPEIMAEAAWHMLLTRPLREYTGYFVLDESVLREAGITDFSGYLAVPGATSALDLFVTD